MFCLTEYTKLETGDISALMCVWRELKISHLVTYLNHYIQSDSVFGISCLKHR